MAFSLTAAFDGLRAAAKSLFRLSDDGGSLATAWNAGTVAYGDTLALARRGRSYTGLLRLIAEDPTAARAVRLVTDNAAALPLAPVAEDGEAVDGPGADALAALMRSPGGDTLPRAAWMGLAVQYLYAGGGFYVDLVDAPLTGDRRPRTLGLIAPDRLSRIERGAVGDVVRLHFTTPAGRAFTRTPDEVVHVRHPDPADPSKGLPVLGAAWRAMERLEAEDSRAIRAARFGGADIPAVFKLSDSETLAAQLAAPGKIDEVTATLRRQYAEAQASGQAMLLAPFVDLATMPTKGAPANAAQDYDRSVRLVASVAGVPPTLLSDQKGGSLTDAGVDSEMKVLLLFTVIPLVEQTLLDALAPVFEQRFGCRLAVDTSAIPALQEDADSLATRVVALVAGGVISTGAARAALHYTDDDAPENVPALPPPPEPRGLLPAAGQAGKAASPDDLADALAARLPAWLLEPSADA